MVFLADSNFFISAYRKHYPMDIAVNYWLRVRDLAHNGTLISIDKVKNEIYKNEDELKQWCVNNLPKDFFKDTIPSVTSGNYGMVCSWATHPNNNYKIKAIDEFLHSDEADAFLIAYAMLDVNNYTIVTNEVSSGALKKVKIPEPCNHFNVRFIEPMELFRMNSIQF